jgi:hypothetical protein
MVSDDFNKYAVFPSIMTATFSFTFYAKMHFSWTDGQYSISGNVASCPFWLSAVGSQIECWIYAGSALGYAFNIVSSWSSGDVLFWAFTGDPTAGPGQKVHCYIKRVGDSVAVEQPFNNAIAGYDYNFAWGGTLDFALGAESTYYKSLMDFDNLKLYNTVISSDTIARDAAIEGLAQAQPHIFPIHVT